MRILCTGDVHIGRRPSRLPRGLDPSACSAAAVWTDIVGRAAELRADVVVLTGDVVDRDNRFYEAYGPLEAGVRRLADAGVDVIAVAGNHDFDVFPRLASGLRRDRFHFLGRDGTWERLTLRRPGQPPVHFDGWSFPGQRVTTDPLETYRLPADGSTPVVGVLHTELDKSDSPYAPVASAALRRVPAALWLLGHLHAPQLLDAASPPILYPGSPQGLGPDETGRHGIWLVELVPGRKPAFEFVPVARVRYDVVTVDLEGVSQPERFDEAATEAIRRSLAASAPEFGPLKQVCCRLRLTGHTPLHGKLDERIAALVADLEVPFDSVVARVERVIRDTAPAVDLTELARSPDTATGILAGFLLQLQADPLPPDAARVLDEALRKMDDVYRSRCHADLRAISKYAAPPDRAMAAEALERQGRSLLAALLAQKSGVA